MPLDPLVQAFLDQLNAQPAPPMWELTPAQAREMFVAMMDLVGPKDVPIGKTENILIPGPGGDICNKQPACRLVHRSRFLVDVCTRSRHLVLDGV